MRTIYFDMDGTIADLYNEEEWLEDILAESTRPFVNAKPMCHMPTFARKCNELRQSGVNIGIITWTPKNASPTYALDVGYAKVKWLTSHLPSVTFDEIIVCEYGTDKSQFADFGDILFDDDINNRTIWEHMEDSIAYDPTSILETLCEIARTLITRP